MAVKMANSDDPCFLEACRVAGVQPTKRQYKKFCAVKGIAAKVKLGKAEQIPHGKGKS